MLWFRRGGLGDAVFVPEVADPMVATDGDRRKLRLHIVRLDEVTAERDCLLAEVRLLRSRLVTAEADRDRLVEALRKRNEPPTDERLADLLRRSKAQSRSRPWRAVGYLVRCVQRAEAERDAERERADQNARAVNANADMIVELRGRLAAAEAEDDLMRISGGQGLLDRADRAEAALAAVRDIAERWACDHSGFDEVLAAAGREPATCHCGEAVDTSEYRNRGMCAHCDDVRCDAYPGECGR